MLVTPVEFGVLAATADDLIRHLDDPTRPPPPPHQLGRLVCAAIGVMAKTAGRSVVVAGLTSIAAQIEEGAGTPRSLQ